MQVRAPSSSWILLLPAILSAVAAFTPTPDPRFQIPGAGRSLSHTVAGSGRGRICARGSFQHGLSRRGAAHTMSAAGGIQLPPVICGAPPVGKRAIIFDIDGTLCDSSHMAMSATNRVLEEHGFPGVSPEEYHLGTRFTTPERLARHAGFSPEDGERFHEQGKILGGKFDEMYIALVDEQTAGFYPGIAQLIADVPPDVQLGALTNAAVAYAEAVLSANNVRQRFTVVHGADSVPRPKPYPDGLRVTLDEMGVSNTDAVYVGDAPSDAMAAARAGVASLGVSYGSHSYAALAGRFDALVTSVEDVRSLLLARASSGVASEGGREAGVASAPPADGAEGAVAEEGRNVARGPEGVAEGGTQVDRDGVLNRDVGRPGVVQACQVEALPGAGAALLRLKRAGVRVSVITNQKSVARGLMSHETLAEIHVELLRQLEAQVASELCQSERLIDAILYSPGIEAEEAAPCFLRLKPDPALVEAAVRLHPHTRHREGVGAVATPKLRGSTKGAAIVGGNEVRDGQAEGGRGRIGGTLTLADTLGCEMEGVALIGDNISDLAAGRRGGVEGVFLVRSSPHGIRASEALCAAAGGAMPKFEVHNLTNPELGVHNLTPCLSPGEIAMVEGREVAAIGAEAEVVEHVGEAVDALLKTNLRQRPEVEF